MAFTLDFRCITDRAVILFGEGAADFSKSVANENVHI